MATPIQLIANAQEGRKLNGDEFSALLGVSGGTWLNIKSGQASPGIKFLSAVVAEFPELQADVLLWMREKGLADKPVVGNGKEPC